MFNIKDKAKEIISNGERTDIDNEHYRICLEGICIVMMKVSPLHVLAKTVYKREWL